MLRPRAILRAVAAFPGAEALMVAGSRAGRTLPNHPGAADATMFAIRGCDELKET